MLTQGLRTCVLGFNPAAIQLSAKAPMSTYDTYLFNFKYAAAILS
jgi:hypothetical protein